MTPTITPIKPYSIEHLLFCLAVIVVVAVLVLMLRKVEKKRMIPCVGIALLILEIWKQILMSKIFSSYSWSDFPFQLCSVPMYLCLLYPFVKRARTVFENFFCAFATLGAIGAFAVPYDVFSPYPLLSIHSTLWHALLLFLGVYCMFAGKTNKSTAALRKEYWKVALLYLGLAIIAVIINALLFNISQGTANMFFLGPSQPYVAILDDIYEKYGWFTETVFMICCSELGGFIIYRITGLREIEF